MMLRAKALFFAILPALAPTIASAQNVLISQLPVWAAKPDISSFEKIENDRIVLGRIGNG